MYRSREDNGVLYDVTNGRSEPLSLGGYFCTRLRLIILLVNDSLIIIYPIELKCGKLQIVYSEEGAQV